MDIDLTCTDHFTKREVLGIHFVDSHAFHLIDVIGHHGLDQLHWINIERENLFHLASHHEGSDLSVQIGIQVVGLIGHEPRRIGSGHGEAVETWAQPAFSQ